MLQLLPAGPIPADTLRVAKAALPEENKYVKLRNLLGPIFDDALFAPLFPKRGQPAATPWRLALVTIMQFAEGLSDRDAADAVRTRVGGRIQLRLAASSYPRSSHGPTAAAVQSALSARKTEPRIPES
jgi:transposase